MWPAAERKMRLPAAEVDHVRVMVPRRVAV
jgi:hypothetical protein